MGKRNDLAANKSVTDVWILIGEVCDLHARARLLISFREEVPKRKRKSWKDRFAIEHIVDGH